MILTPFRSHRGSAKSIGHEGYLANDISYQYSISDKKDSDLGPLLSELKALKAQNAELIQQLEEKAAMISSLEKKIKTLEKKAKAAKKEEEKKPLPPNPDPEIEVNAIVISLMVLGSEEKLGG
jgi:hypothetical protein